MVSGSGISLVFFTPRVRVIFPLPFKRMVCITGPGGLYIAWNAELWTRNSSVSMSSSSKGQNLRQSVISSGFSAASSNGAELGPWIVCKGLAP